MSLLRRQTLISLFIDSSSSVFLDNFLPKIKNVTFEFKNQSILPDKSLNDQENNLDNSNSVSADSEPAVNTIEHTNALSDETNSNVSMYEGSG
jgi:hypothetical protein